MHSFIYEEQVIRMNKQAIEEIKLGNLQKAMNLLKNALASVKKVQDDPPKSRILTQIFNSFGNLFKKAENWEESLKFFQKCIQLENHLRDDEKGYVALAYLSIGTVYSQLSDHTKAVKYTNQSIFLMKNLIKQHPKLVSSLVIGHYNLANEYKYLGEHSKAENLLRNALNISKDRLGPGHQLTETISKALYSVPYQKIPQINKENLSLGPTPYGRLPIVSKKRSSSDNRDHSRHSTFRRYLETAGPLKESFVNSFYNPKKPAKKNPSKNFSDEDSDKSFSHSTWTKRIDLQRHKETERNAAVIIQSWWRGVRARRAYNEKKLKFELKQAEIRAKKAVEDLEKIKMRVSKAKRGYRK